MKLTPAILAAAYELLKETPPFASWNLPAAEDVHFVVTREKNHVADHKYDRRRNRHQIRLSETKHEYLSTVLTSMAHEMVHVHEEHTGIAGRGEHGAAFHKLAKVVCRHHGFDLGQF